MVKRIPDSQRLKHKCVKCDYSSDKKSNLTRHLEEGEACLRGQAILKVGLKPVRGLSRQRNVRRTIEARVGDFILYLKDNIRRQFCNKDKEFVRYSPTDNAELKANDPGGIINILLREKGKLANTCTEDHLHRRLVARAVIAATMWTKLFTSIVGLPPIPITPQYCDKVKAKLINTWEKGQQVANGVVQGHGAKSIKGAKTKEEAEARVDKILETIKAIVAIIPSACKKLED